MSREAGWYRQTMIETTSGAFVDLASPEPESIRLGDVAFHLDRGARRFSGSGVSVAEHAVFCAAKAKVLGLDAVTALACLHHDDAEAYLGDVVRPLKGIVGDRYRDLTAMMDDVIIEALGLPFDSSVYHGGIVKEIDNWAMYVEAYRVLPSKGEGWTVPVLWPVDEIDTPWIGGMKDPATVWLSWHHALLSQARSEIAGRASIPVTPADYLPPGAEIAEAFDVPSYLVGA